jgi:hypothetical protein
MKTLPDKPWNWEYLSDNKMKKHPLIVKKTRTITRTDTTKNN